MGSEAVDQREVVVLALLPQVVEDREVGRVAAAQVMAQFGGAGLDEVLERAAAPFLGGAAALVRPYSVTGTKAASSRSQRNTRPS